VTPREVQVLDYIRAYTSEHVYSPSYQEMAKHLGAASTSSVHRIVRALKRKGFLEQEPGHSRSLKVAASNGLPPDLEMLLLLHCRAQRITRETAIREAVASYLGAY